MFFVELLILYCFPLLLACSASYLTWNALSRPVLFLVIATVALYLVYATSMWLLDPGPMGGYVLVVREPGEAHTSEPWFSMLSPYKVPFLVFSFAAIPVLAILLRAFKKGVR